MKNATINCLDSTDDLLCYWLTFGWSALSFCFVSIQFNPGLLIKCQQHSTCFMLKGQDPTISKIATAERKKRSVSCSA